jgi:hypothetical protein
MQMQKFNESVWTWMFHGQAKHVIVPDRNADAEYVI